MELSDLTAYAEEKYHIAEQHKWADFPGFSALADPVTGKWIALLMRQWDQQTGTELQRCDLKCGQQSLLETPAPYLGTPYRMKGKKWIGICFDESTEAELVFRLFDRAIHSGEQRGYTIVLEDRNSSWSDSYCDTPLPSSGMLFTEETLPEIPQHILEMMRLYEPGDGSLAQKCRNFYVQGKCMEDYKDELSWFGEFSRYFPTYHDLNIRQLRGYFTWRTAVRKGLYRPVTLSFAYIYLYEVLGEIGTASPSESLDKLLEFEQCFLNAGYGDESMRKNLRRWMLEFAVLHDVPPEQTRGYADPALLKRDNALSVLKNPFAHPDEAIYDALCTFGGEKLSQSPVILNEPARGKALFAALWRGAASQYDGDLFTACFGTMRAYPWRPLSNAVYWEAQPHAPSEFVLNDCRRYICRGGVWEQERYDRLNFDEARFNALLREGDRLFRKYLKCGHYLRAKPGESWATPYAEAVVAADQKAAAEAARPKITIDFSGLERIRQDAGHTRDSLLTESDMEDSSPPVPEVQAPVPTINTSPPPSSDNGGDIDGLDPVHTAILSALFQAQSVRDIIREHHLMPSVVTDTINEALFDAIGDSVLEYDGVNITVVEDYREELAEILGGIPHE